MTKKTCSHCREEKPVEDFGLNRQTPDGRMYYCRVCAAIKQREYRTLHPESAMKSKRKYLAKLRAQNDAARGQEQESND
jgi:hypothetical protein